MSTTAKLAYRVTAAAEQLDISEREVWRLIARGELVSIRVGRARLVPASALEGFVRSKLNEENATAGQAVALEVVSRGQRTFASG